LRHACLLPFSCAVIVLAGLSARAQSPDMPAVFRLTAVNSTTAQELTFSFDGGLNGPPNFSLRQGSDFSIGAAACDSNYTTCTLEVTFIPHHAGLLEDAVIVKNSSGQSIGQMLLSGTAGDSAAAAAAAPATAGSGQASAPGAPASSSAQAFHVKVSNASVEAVSPAMHFIPVTPCRVVDTRNATGTFGGPEMTGGETRAFPIPTGSCGIPANATAYSVNVTVVPDAILGFLAIWPDGLPRPLVSTLNSDGRVKANAAIVPAGNNGAIDVYVSHPTQVVLDINGYFVPSGSVSNGLAFYPVAPCRIYDTRTNGTTLGGLYNQARAFQISGNCGIPSTAKAFSLNITAVPHDTLGFLATWPSGQSQPVVSTLNSDTGAVTANAAIVPAGAGGEVSIFVSAVTDIVIDADGYFAPPGSGGLSLYTLTPCRVLDTRNPAGTAPFSGIINVPVATSSCSVSSTAQAYVLNATVVPPGTIFNYLTLWPEGGTQPFVSTLNAADGAVTSNMAIVPTTNGSVSAFASDPVQLVLDVSSYFAP